MEQTKGFIEDGVREQILSSLSTMHEAACYLVGHAVDEPIFLEFTNNLAMLVELIIPPVYACVGGEYSLMKICESIRATVARIRTGNYRPEQLDRKLQFELAPLLEEAYLQAYYYLWAVMGKDQLAQYRAQLPDLCSNYYVDQAEERGKYPYEVAFVVTGCNKLDRTKMCVESLLRSIPNGLKYELILVNHGSTDGTREYFESIHPTKQLDIAVNGGGNGCIARICESRYVFGISNDVILEPNAIENALTCIRSNPQIACVVSAAPDTANPQISIMRTSVCWGKNGGLLNGSLPDASGTAFPDDQAAPENAGM